MDEVLLEVVAISGGKVLLDQPGIHSTAGNRAPSLFPLWSFTKTLIAAGLLRLRDAGRLQLGDPVTKWVPELALARPPSIEQLMAHVSGVPDYGTLPAYHRDVRANPGTPWPTERFLDVAGSGRDFPRGKGWRYSNTGYVLLRLALERATGQSLDTALRRLLWDPTGVSTAFVLETPADMGRLVPGYGDYLGSTRDVRTIYHPGWVGHRSAASSALDAARVLEAIVAGTLLEERSRTALVNARRLDGVLAALEAPGYGLGVMTGRLPGGEPVAGHAGAGPGYSAAVFTSQARGAAPVTVAVLANRELEAQEIAVTTLERLTRGKEAR